MKIPSISPELIEGLRSRFHPKDRSVYLAADCLAYLSNGAYLSNAFIAETVLSASAASVTFSNIPQDFRHLMLLTQARTDAALEADNILVRFNNDSGTGYDREILVLAGTSVTALATRAAATAQGIVICEAANSRAANFSPGISWILNYSVSGRDKHNISLSQAFGDASADADLLGRLIHGRWRNTNVITSLVLLPNGGPNFVSGSQFQLYGIL